MSTTSSKPMSTSSGRSVPGARRGRPPMNRLRRTRFVVLESWSLALMVFLTFILGTCVGGIILSADPSAISKLSSDLNPALVDARSCGGWVQVVPQPDGSNEVLVIGCKR